MDAVHDTRVEPLPTALSSLIEGAVATFDADRDAARRYLERAYALLRARFGQRSPRSAPGPARSSPAGLAAWQVNRVLDHIDAHLPGKICLDELAKLIRVSRGQLCRGFKVSVGVSPSRFIAGKRIELACRLLETTREPLAQIAILCGSYDQSHFCRVFRRATGMSPAAWRRAHALDPGHTAPKGSEGPPPATSVWLPRPMSAAVR
jgi:transcriptional regulator GlxA family with amidase domain